MRNRGRTRLTLQRRGEGNDGFGPNPAAGDWEDVVDVGVSLSPKRGDESQRNGVSVAVQRYEVEIRTSYVSGSVKLDETWRLLDKSSGKTFNIEAVALKDDDYRWSRVSIAEGDPS